MAAKPAADKASEEAFASLDIGGYNYAASRYEIDKDLHPNRVIVGSETLPKNLYKNWQLVKKLPYVIGDFMWTGWDYLGEAGIGTVRYKSFKNREMMRRLFLAAAVLLISVGKSVLRCSGTNLSGD